MRVGLVSRASGALYSKFTQDAVKTFDYLTENFQGNLISELSVSKGVVVCSEHIELNFEEIKAMADKLMYADKDEYYRRTGKDRRRV